MKSVDDTKLGGPLHVLEELPSRGTSAGWRKESRETLNIQQERSLAQQKSTGAWLRGERGQSPPCIACPCGTPIGKMPCGDHSDITTWHLLQL